MESTAENCQRAIDAYDAALQFYIPDRAPLEYADVLRDQAFAYVALSEVDDKEECCKKALKIYKKAFKIYSGTATELEEKGDPTVVETRDLAEKCHRSMEACKRILKVIKKSKKASQPPRRSEHD
jgi:tetratricopeptide (TPR) repeat protein